MIGQHDQLSLSVVERFAWRVAHVSRYFFLFWLREAIFIAALHPCTIQNVSNWHPLQFQLLTHFINGDRAGDEVATHMGCVQWASDDMSRVLREEELEVLLPWLTAHTKTPHWIVYNILSWAERKRPWFSWMRHGVVRFKLKAYLTPHCFCHMRFANWLHSQLSNNLGL